MDGTALYECVAVMFIAQAYGIELGHGNAVHRRTVGANDLDRRGRHTRRQPGRDRDHPLCRRTPEELEGIGLILAVDRILDMMRTAVNVAGDSAGAVIIARTEGEKPNVGL
jgi:proton glutamate symport protein